MTLGLIGIGLVLLLWLGWMSLRPLLTPRVRGLVVNVESKDLGHAAALTVRVADGRQLRFLVGPKVDAQWTPGHLRDHMILGQPVTVFYRQQGNQLLATEVQD